MSQLPTIVAPDVKEDERLRPSFNEEVHEGLKDRWDPWFITESIHFHKPNHFLDRVISIKAARQWWSSPLWLSVAILFGLSFLFSRAFGILGPTIFLIFQNS